jgi:hypothetical protein
MDHNPFAGDHTFVVGSYEQALRQLQELVYLRESAFRQGDDMEVTGLNILIMKAILVAARVSPNPQTLRFWEARATSYDCSNKTVCRQTLKDIGTGRLVIIGAPIALAGGVIFAAGGFLYIWRRNGCRRHRPSSDIWTS